MAKSSPPTAVGGSDKSSSLTALRTKIDKIDRDLVALMNGRAAVARQIGHIKSTDGQAT